MEVSLYEQALKFLCALLTGFHIAIIYQAFAVFRGVLPHSNLFVFIEDIIFSFIATASCFALLYKHNDGQFRGYLIFGVIAAFTLWMATVGFFTKPIVKILRRVLSVILYPFC